MKFGAMFKTVNMWGDKFYILDRDKSGFLDMQEFIRGLIQMGFRLSQMFAKNLITLYGQNMMTLDNAIVTIFQITRFSDSFQRRDKGVRGLVALTYEDFIGLAMRAHN